MIALIDVILPVFLIIMAGFAARWVRIFSDSAADGLMTFTQRFAIPCLLFSAMSTLDLESDFDAGLLLSFYFGVCVAFLLGALGARLFFNRSASDCVAIGFGAAFSNSVLLGLPIMERAYGAEALAPNFTIVALHAPVLYLIGIISMEMVRSKEKAFGFKVLLNIFRAVFSNALVIGIALGFFVNVLDITTPVPLDAAISMMASASLPAALFGLGAVLVRYRPQGDMRVIAMLATLSLLIHPAATWSVGTLAFDITDAQLRSAIVTAAMAPGINTYVFAHMYGAAKRVAASSVLICTALSGVSAWFWLSVLP